MKWSTALACICIVAALVMALVFLFLVHPTLAVVLACACIAAGLVAAYVAVLTFLKL